MGTRMNPPARKKYAILLIALLAAFAANSQANPQPIDDFSLEDLVKTDITSVSRKSQSLIDVAAAAFVISSEDIRRSGAQALPDVLRMAPGIEVAHIDNGRYAVIARGFNGRFANKLLVLLDGRSIYHPMFSGVMWELDPVPLEDIERIEVIRGAGAVMWGANAVNGVINIITKHSRTQTGGAVNVSAGNRGAGNVYARIGQADDTGTSWKLSAQGRHMEPSKQYVSRQDSDDRLTNSVVDFRFDRDLNSGRDLSIWANASHSSLDDLWMTFPKFQNVTLPAPYSITVPFFTGLSSMPVSQKLHNESLVGRYRWLSDAGIESSVQVSLATSGIEIVNFIDETRNTFDFDYQARYAVGAHDVLWGLSHRTSSDDIATPGTYFSIHPSSYTQRNSGIFLHDDWTLLPERLKLGMGVRWDNASRNGSYVSPNATLLWTPSRSDSVWLKYARAPRTAARAEQDISVYSSVNVTSVNVPFPPKTVAIPTFIYAQPGSKGTLHAEHTQGIEVGYRKQFSPSFSADINLYRYHYTDLRSGSLTGIYGCSPLFGALGITYPPTNPAACPAELRNMTAFYATGAASNEVAGWSNGAEMSLDWLVTASWRLQLSYAWSRLSMNHFSDAGIQADARNLEKSTPRHYGSLRSQWNVDSKQQIDVWLRGSAGFERLNSPYTTTIRVPGYLTADLRYAYRFDKNLEVALIGRNLIGARRFEYVSDYISTVATELAPTVMLTTRWTF